MKVIFIHSWINYLNQPNSLFLSWEDAVSSDEFNIDSYDYYWSSPYKNFKNIAISKGHELGTVGDYPIGSADVLWFIDIPHARRDVTFLKTLVPKAKVVFQMIESPVLYPYMMDYRNHDIFDVVITYNGQICSKKQYHHYFLPFSFINYTPDGKVPIQHQPLPFELRKSVIMLNTNSKVGLFASPRSSPFFSPLPGGSVTKRGWYTSLKWVIEQERGELLSTRRKLAYYADENFPSLIDIYGQNWEGEKIGWLDTFTVKRKLKSAQGRLNLPKSRVLPNYRFCIAYENFRGNWGYISEKIFDCLYAGVVPVYLGDAEITKHVPPNCFVDARNFKNERELLIYLRDCSESEWLYMLEAGEKFIRSESIKKFQFEEFGNRMSEILESIISI